MTRLFAFLMLIVAMLGASPATAGTCTAANQFNFTYASQAAATLAYGSTYNYTATTSGGGSRAFSVQVTQNGLTNTTVNGNQMPAISTLVTGADATLRDLVLGGTFGARTTSIAGTTNVVTVIFTFAVPVRDFTMTVHDVDFSANQYRDLIQITGTGAATYTPGLASPAGNNNGSGSRTATGSSLSFGPVTTPTTITASQAVGVGAAGNNSNDGNITAIFAQPVTTVTVKYGNAPYTTGENTTGQQGIGIAGISFCPMPQLTVTKSSSPMSGTLGAYNLPGNDILYTLTVTNSGGSPVDATSIVLSDVLPTGVTFRNTVLDAPSNTPFSINAGSSGVGLSSSSPAYSNNGGSTYAYTPAAGYDANVRAVRVTPTGMMAANSSFSISFVARIN